MDENRLPPGVRIRHELKPGDIGYLTYLHGTLYATEQGWDYMFEAYVAGPLAEFARSQKERERIWIIDRAGQVAGSIAIVEASAEAAQLRWLLLHPDLRGYGLGRMLVEDAIRFCRECGYASVFLWTVDTLKDAARLYIATGFRLMQEETHELWGGHITEQRYELSL
ncbi:MAG: GNAT family N-acetyltransferase [Blastocatellia bacterium]